MLRLGCSWRKSDSTSSTTLDTTPDTTLDTTLAAALDPPDISPHHALVALPRRHHVRRVRFTPALATPTHVLTIYL
jgi:hypothetical protein